MSAPVIRRFMVLDPAGNPLAVLRGEAVLERALRRREVAPTDDPKVYRLARTEGAWRELTPVEKLALAKEKAARR